jgi:aspartate racemase
MKTLGIIGGVGPESTIEYYRTIISLYRARAGDGSYPQIIINSIDLKKEIDLVAAGDDCATTRYLVEEVEKIAAAGADFGIIASNTPHVVFEQLAEAVSIPLLSIVEVAAAAAKARRWRRPALFGTRFTVYGSFYPAVFLREGIYIVRPNSEEVAYIHDKYMNELVEGRFLPEIRTRLFEIIDRMKDRDRIDSVLLAGTELPLLLRDAAYNGIPLLDTMRVHAEAAVSRMFEK